MYKLKVEKKGIQAIRDLLIHLYRLLKNKKYINIKYCVHFYTDFFMLYTLSASFGTLLLLLSVSLYI